MNTALKTMGTSGSSPGMTTTRPTILEVLEEPAGDALQLGHECTETAGNAVVPSPHPRSNTLSPLVMPSRLTNSSPLSRMLAAMRVKSPFSHSALFGFI